MGGPRTFLGGARGSTASHRSALALRFLASFFSLALASTSKPLPFAAGFVSAAAALVGAESAEGASSGLSPAVAVVRAGAGLATEGLVAGLGLVAG